jgi:cytochrome P450
MLPESLYQSPCKVTDKKRAESDGLPVGRVTVPCWRREAAAGPEDHKTDKGTTPMAISAQTATRCAPPTLDADPYAVEVILDPYRFHEQLREAGPVVELEKYGVYAVGRYEEAMTVLTDYERFESAGGIGIQDIRKPGNFRTPSKLIEVDPPEHTVVRTALNKILTPVVVRKWRDDFEREAEVFVDRVVAMGSFDGIEDFAEAYVMKVFAEAVGVELPRTETLAIGEMRFNQTGPENELYHRAMERAQPYLSWFEQARQREKMVPGSIGDMLFDAEDAGNFPPGYASNLLLTFVGGGTDSSISGIGTALHQLAKHPDQLALLRSDPSLAKSILDEAIRFDAPFQIVYRTVRDNIEFAGYDLRGGTKIAVFIGAANRDPRKWPEPDKFDLMQRTAGIHLAFGSSTHVCIGQMIARLESESLLRALARKVSTLELAGTPKFRPLNQLRTLDYLPLKVTVA